MAVTMLKRNYKKFEANGIYYGQRDFIMAKHLIPWQRFWLDLIKLGEVNLIRLERNFIFIELYRIYLYGSF